MGSYDCNSVAADRGRQQGAYEQTQMQEVFEFEKLYIMQFLKKWIQNFEMSVWVISSFPRPLLYLLYALMKPASWSTYT